MKALAKGNNEEVIIKLLKTLINTTQGVSIREDTMMDHCVSNTILQTLKYPY